MSGAALRLGTRRSRLALVQARIVAQAIRERGTAVELVEIVTGGDRRAPDTPWGDGVFVDALEAALRDGSIDVAVHSAKDVPIEDPDRPTDLTIAAYPAREDARDVLVTRRGGASLATLPRGASVGTDSPRRTGFVLAARPDLRVVPLSGNVDTRLRRLDASETDALVLAAAGLLRLGLGHRIDETLDPDLVPPAPGQGALAIQVRTDDRATRSAIEPLDEPQVRAAVSLERAVLRAMGGGCRAPVGALVVDDGDGLALVAGAVRPDGGRRRTIRLDPSETGRADVVGSVTAYLRGADLGDAA